MALCGEAGKIDSMEITDLNLLSPFLSFLLEISFLLGLWASDGFVYSWFSVVVSNHCAEGSTVGRCCGWGVTAFQVVQY